MAVCSVDTCDRPKGPRRGWCRTHYNEWAKTGQSPVKVIRAIRPSRFHHPAVPSGIGAIRVCVQCTEPKSPEDFRVSPNRRDKLDVMCKRCRHWNARLVRMSMKEEDFRSRLEDQNFCCAGCGDLLSENWSKVYIDHDHACCPGIRSCGDCVRGLLHNACNVIIGQAQDSPALLRRLAVYLEGT